MSSAMAGSRWQWWADHRQYKHPTKKGRTTIAGKPGADLHPKTARSIFRQAQIPWPKGRR
jgi:hypothetical protein